MTTVESAKPMVTMTDIAREAGVSRATVSFVLNGRHEGVRISAETRRVVAGVANKLGYQPNDLARAVVTGRSQVIGFVTDETGYEPIGRILAGVLDEAEAHQHFIKVFHLKDARFDRETIEKCVRQRLVGVVVCSLHEYVNRVPLRDDLIEEMRGYGIQMAVVGSNMYMHSDDRQGFRMLVTHLKELGHRRIAFVSGRADAVISMSRDREWTQVMLEVGLAIPPGYLHHDCWEVEGTDAALRQLMKHPAGAPTAICCVTDRAAMQMLRSAHRAGLSVPRDLSVTGFGNLSMTILSSPPLTTVAQPFEAMGAAAVRRLWHLTAHGSQADGQHELLQPELVVRESTAAPA